MNTNQIHFDNQSKNSFTIGIKKTSLFTRIILILFTFLFFIAPIIGLFINLIERNELRIGIFISFIFFWLIALFLGRLVLWNIYGKEIYYIDESKIKYCSDFKYFKDSFKEIKNIDLNMEFEKIGYIEDNFGVLLIKNQTEYLKSAIKVPIPELRKFIAEINTTPNNAYKK